MVRRLFAVPAVAGVVVAVVAGCSSTSPTSSPPPSSSTTTSAAASSVSPSPSTAAASSSNQGDELLPDPATLLKEANKSTQALKSVHLALTVNGTVAEMPVKSLQGDLTNAAGPAAKGDAKITIMGAGVGIQFVEIDRRLYVAMPAGGWRDYGFTSNAWDVTAIIDPDDGLADLLTAFVDPKAEARETIDGQDTIRVAGKVTADAVNKIVPLGATKKMSCTVWIQERGDHQLVRVKLEPGKDDSVEMTLSNWNAPVTVDKPA